MRYFLAAIMACTVSFMAAEEACCPVGKTPKPAAACIDADKAPKDAAACAVKEGAACDIKKGAACDVKDDTACAEGTACADTTKLTADELPSAVKAGFAAVIDPAVITSYCKITVDGKEAYAAKATVDGNERMLVLHADGKPLEGSSCCPVAGKAKGHVHGAGEKHEH